MTEKRNSRELLIETASKLFRIRGYYGVGLKDILNESGVPKGSLYHYFPNGKEELAIEAINHTRALVIKDIQAKLDEVADPIEAIQAHILQLSEIFSESDNLLGVPIGTIAAETYSTCEPIRIVCQSAFENWQSLYSKKLLEAGYSEKQSKELSIVINALIEGGIIYSQTSNSGEPLRVIASKIPLLLKKND
ncbi:TetR/AcrR family transcriptional regulator [Paenibacillus endoradicis]|uniref:TetR/AcrR family transcriptional regulator n=1 Tax=Paenibacillus endoradicis TaxID=2972487 RepID=UPI00215979D6|nr:TetR/AcrR family transcriptional regulator [Paenibacillus endoradicis]MCR8659682.1 TetR/AcrR family transcriptional regulator [Paenibacillus endoradicis]